MTVKTKKILKITAVVLTIIFVGFLIYYIFFKKTTQPTTPSENINVLDENGESIEKQNRLIAITEEAVLGAGLKNENKISYIAWDGTINEIALDGSEKNKIGLITGERISEVSFSKNGDKMIAKQTSSSGGVKFLLFNSIKNSLKTLTGNVKNASFNPSGEQIITSTYENNVYKINTLKDDGSQQKTITTTKIPDLILEWYTDNLIAFKTRPSGIAKGIVYTFDLKTKKTNRVLGNMYGLIGRFSPSGEKLLFSETDSYGKKNSLKSLDLSKKTEKSISILSIPDKCAWSNDNRTIFCSNINMGSGSNLIMPDDYYKGKIKLGNEDIIKINLELGKTQKIITAQMDAYKPFLSSDETYLFFINKVDGRLYRLTL